MYVDSSACVGIKGDVSKQFRIDSGVRQGVSCPPCCSTYIYGWSNEGHEDGDGKEGSELPGGWERKEIAWPLVCR